MSETINRDDLISRKDALNLSCSITWRVGDVSSVIKECFEAYRDHIESLPSAEAVHGVGRYENAIQKLREMPRYLNGIKKKQITKISAEVVPLSVVDKISEECERLEDRVAELEEQLADTVSREVYEKRTQADERIIDSYRREFSEVVSAEAEWIPCSERLPDIKEHYVSVPCLVYCENGAYGFAELEENIFGQVGWNCERDDEYHEMLGEVIAWMPLPTPYKGGDDE